MKNGFNIKYIENNLVFNNDNECFAYYELIPFNYSFLSPDEKLVIHDKFRQLISGNKDGKIHALQIACSEHIKDIQKYDLFLPKSCWHVFHFSRFQP